MAMSEAKEWVLPLVKGDHKSSKAAPGAGLQSHTIVAAKRRGNRGSGDRKHSGIADGTTATATDAIGVALVCAPMCKGEMAVFAKNEQALGERGESPQPQGTCS